MRYVMVWFTCSVEGCEARAEHLARAYQEMPNSKVIFLAGDLPEGWGQHRLSNVKRHDLKDESHTYCPEHAEPSYKP